MNREIWVGDDPPADEPEEFEWVTNYAAHEFRNVHDVHSNYRAKGWATPISGDHTTIRERFLR